VRAAVAFVAPMAPAQWPAVAGARTLAETCPAHTAPPSMAAKGFGFKPSGSPSNNNQKTPQRQPSDAAVARGAAAERLDAMRQQGLPEFSVWVRLATKEKPDDPDFPWLPVGSLSVPRSGDINKAIFDVQADLMQGVYRLFPNMKGKEDDLQFGWQNKEFTDEEICVARKPLSSSSAQSMFQSFLARLPKWG
jgi:Family of unknown function (DUF6523)